MRHPRALLSAAAVAVLAAFVILVLVACTAAPSTGVSRPSTGLPCAVSDVLARRCQTCHGETPQYGAPMRLVTRADLVAPSQSEPTRRVFEQVGIRVHDSARPMPKAPNPPLDAADTRVLDAWIASGAREVTDACTPSSGPPDAGVKLTCAPDVHIRPAAPYVMPSDVDDILVCYGWESTARAKRHLIALSPAISATKQLHHVTLLESDVAVSTTPGPTTRQPSFT